jgi:hypothetical protein
MATLNESKYEYLLGQVGPPEGTLNELEYRWLASLTGKPTDLHLEEQWHTYLDLLGVPAGPLGQRQYTWLLTTGVTGISDKLTLNENFYLFWNQIGGIIVGGEANLTAGTGSGTRVGFRAGVYGDMNPDVTSRNDPINALFVRNSNGRVRFKVQGEYQRTAFNTMAIVGQGTLLEADANYDFDGVETEWVWSGTGFTLTDGDVYLILFT